MAFLFLVKVAERRKLFEGDINIVQHNALQGLILHELSKDNSREEERMKYTILSGNIDLYKKLFDNKEEDSDIPIITPTTREEMDELVKFLDSPKIAGEFSGSI